MKFSIFGYVPSELLLTGKSYKDLGFEVKYGHVFIGEILEVYDEDSLIFLDELPVVTEAQRESVKKKLVDFSKNFSGEIFEPMVFFLV